MALSADDRRRIALIVLNSVDGPSAREFRRQCRSARHADRTTLVPELRMRLDSPNESLAWRAYCAAVGMLDLAWPRRRLREESLAGMATMRERLRILPEAR